MTIISQIFFFRIISEFKISEFLNSRVCVHVFYKVYSDSLFNSENFEFARQPIRE